MKVRGEDFCVCIKHTQCDKQFMFRTKQTTIHNLYLAHNGSIIYIVRSPTDGKPQSMLEYPQCVCKNNHIYTMWVIETQRG